MRTRWLGLLMALSVLLGAAAEAEAAYPVVAGGVAALVDAEGVDLIPEGSCEDVFRVVEGQLYAVGAPGSYRLVNERGEAVGDQTFDMISASDGALLYRVGRQYGAMDAEGRELASAEWTQLTTDGRGGFLALDSSPLDDQSDALIRLWEGEARLTGASTASGLARVADDRMPVMDPQGRWGYVDGAGAMVLPPRFVSAGPFQDGLATASDGDGLGLIDTDGRWVIAPGYAWLQRGEAMIAAQTDDGRVEVFPPEGGEASFRLEGVRSAALAGPYLAAYSEESAALYDSDGHRVALAGAGALFSPGLNGQTVLRDGVWGEACCRLIDSDGQAVSDDFQQILPLGALRYAFLVFPAAEYYSRELESVQKSLDYNAARWGLMDERGQVLLEAEYREIRLCGSDRLILVTDGAVTFADLDGAPVRTWVTARSEAPSGAAAGEATD